MHLLFKYKISKKVINANIKSAFMTLIISKDHL